MALKLVAKEPGSGKVLVSYANANNTIEIGICKCNVSLKPNLTYSGNLEILAEITDEHFDEHLSEYNIKKYALGYRKEGSVEIIWGTTGPDNNSEPKEIKCENAGKYHIYKRYCDNQNHVDDPTYWGNPGVEVGVVEIYKALADITAGIIQEYQYNPISYTIELPFTASGAVIFPENVNVGFGETSTTWTCTRNGTITVPDATDEGEYTISAHVTIEGNDNYESGEKTLTWYLTINRDKPKNISDEYEYFVSDYKHPDYVRLDDDVSFQITRTNPKLTTNTKLMYDGKNMYMEAYHAAPILSTMKYKNFKVHSTSLFNKDLRKFLLGTDMTAYTVGQNTRDTIVLNSFDNQFENMYWCGVESINSDVYPQEMGCIAPLYLRKKRPNYFVIFKIDTPANTNLVEEKDTNYDFKKDILEKAKIIKAFDLREGTPIGNYIKRYVEQKNFEYDRSIYVNFSSNEIYYYGIDKSSGVLVQKVENFEQQLLNNDNTITKIDDWITSGFERNNLIFPYIINLEFLFDDNETGEYKFARYFGMYCNDIDLYDTDVTNMTNGDNDTNISVSEKQESIKMSEDNFYYIKDKYNNIFSIKEPETSGGSVDFVSQTKLNSKDFTGFEPTSVSAYAERIQGTHSIMVLEVFDTLYDKLGGNNAWVTVKKDVITPLCSICTKKQLNPGEFEKTNETNPYRANYYFSPNGECEDIATALVGIINDYKTDEFEWIRAYTIGNKIVIESINPGIDLDGCFNISFDRRSELSIRKLTDRFEGGTSIDGCVFKVYTNDKNIFINSEDPRYLRCIKGRNDAKILSFIPYIHDREIDDTYSLLITDDNSQYVKVSGMNEVEIIDKFYTSIGLLSFFPVKDFDFDMVSSAYGNGDMMQEELDTVNHYIEIKYYGDDKTPTDMVLHTIDIPYGRFFYHNGNKINTEYEYFFENIIPELCTVNKVVPYITKWGYIDDSKDSCENVYRLNTSKIFETCNFSANTFSKNGDILEYTHSMPYYVNNLYRQSYNEYNLRNEYQYIPISSEMWEHSTSMKKNENGQMVDPTRSEDDVLNIWIEYFLNGETNNFEKMFGDTSRSPFTNKRFNKKYSRFLLGNKVNRSSTLFRGVKFEIEELKGEKEVYSGKFNNYKFSFIYIPVWNIPDNKYTVHFIKNDKYRFIVGLTLFDIKTNLKNREFNKAFIYAGSMSYVEKNKNNEGNATTSEVLDDFNEMSVGSIKEHIISGKEDKVIYHNTKDVNDYRIKIIDPDSINVYDIFASKVVEMYNDRKKVIGSMDIGLKDDVNELRLKTINRYSGYYNPIFKDILFYNNMKVNVNGVEEPVECPFSNTSFDYDYEDSYGKFGIINNMWFHKANDGRDAKIINTTTPYYPLTGQYALDYRDYNIFETNWDKGHFVEQYDIENSEVCDNIVSMKDDLCMLGSKYLNVPEIIEIYGLTLGDDSEWNGEWNGEWITQPEVCPGEIMFKEVNDNSVDFYIFLKKRIIRFFQEKLMDEFKTYISPKYSFGRKGLDDDIEEYVKKNILKLYKLDKVRFFVRRTKKGVHNSRIENDYTKYLEYDKTCGEIEQPYFQTHNLVEYFRQHGFAEVNNIRLNKVNTDDFDRKIVYNLKNGYKEEFGFSFVLKKI